MVKISLRVSCQPNFSSEQQKDFNLMISPASRHSNIHLSQTAHTAYRAWEGENKLATPPVTVPVRASNKIEMPPKCHLVFDIIAFWGCILDVDVDDHRHFLNSRARYFRWIFVVSTFLICSRLMGPRRAGTGKPRILIC